MRIDRRAFNEFRDTKFTTNYLSYPDASVLIETGNTKVICSVTIQQGVPKFLKGTDTGWLTAEYSMLPTATHDRNQREAQKGRIGGRTWEIQRLISRCLRNALSLDKMGAEITLIVDCDVIQADGGTRTASINGASVALYMALQKLQERKKIAAGVFKHLIGAISCGIVQDQLLLDLNYQEDSHAQSDCNFIMTDDGNFTEIQSSAEEKTISKQQLTQMIDMAQISCAVMIEKQKEALGLK